MSKEGRYFIKLEEKEFDKLVRRLFISYIANILQAVAIVLLIIKLLA